MRRAWRCEDCKVARASAASMCNTATECVQMPSMQTAQSTLAAPGHRRFAAGVLRAADNSLSVETIMTSITATCDHSLGLAAENVAQE